MVLGIMGMFSRKDAPIGRFFYALNEIFWAIFAVVTAVAFLHRMPIVRHFHALGIGYVFHAIAVGGVFLFAMWFSAHHKADGMSPAPSPQTIIHTQQQLLHKTADLREIAPPPYERVAPPAYAYRPAGAPPAIVYYAPQPAPVPPRSFLARLPRW